MVEELRPIPTDTSVDLSMGAAPTIAEDHGDEVTDWLSVASAIREWSNEDARHMAEDALAHWLQHLVHPPRLVVADDAGS